MPSNFVVRGVLLVGQLAVPKGLSRPVLAVGHLAHDATAVYAELENSDLSQKVAFLERELAAAKRNWRCDRLAATATPLAEHSERPIISH